MGRRALDRPGGRRRPRGLGSAGPVPAGGARTDDGRRPGRHRGPQLGGAPAESETQAHPEPPVPLGHTGVGRRPPAERASTGAAQREAHGRGVLALGIVGILAATASFLWGLQNHRTASEWRDRGEALQEELVTRASNTDALEEALSQSASRGAQARDGQQSFAELRDAAVTTVDQVRACALDLNHVMIALQLGDDPSIPIEQANRSCEEASLNGETLIRVLDEVAGS